MLCSLDEGALGSRSWKRNARDRPLVCSAPAGHRLNMMRSGTQPRDRVDLNLHGRQSNAIQWPCTHLIRCVFSSTMRRHSIPTALELSSRRRNLLYQTNSLCPSFSCGRTSACRRSQGFPMAQREPLFVMYVSPQLSRPKSKDQSAVQCQVCQPFLASSPALARWS